MTLSSNQAKQILARVSQTFGKTPLHQALADRKAIVGPSSFPEDDVGKRAQEAKDALEAGKDPGADGFAVLELMIKVMRPAPLFKSGQLEGLDPQAKDVFQDWDGFRAAFEPYIYSVARINDRLGEGVGTGFLVAKNLLATNAHVVDCLSNGTRLLQKGMASVDFHKQLKDFEPDKAEVVGTVVHNKYDLALLQLVDPKESERLPISINDASVDAGTKVVAVGYPYDDPKRNPAFVNAIFKNIFGVKRACPGLVISSGSEEVLHDCSTTGGSSGSPLISMDDAKVVAVHNEGMFMYRNHAIPSKLLKEFVQAHA